MMKKLLYILFLFISIKANAQTGDPIRDKLDTIFQNIDKTQIPTGYLAEYGSEFTPLHWYNGVLTDSNIVFNLDIFKMIYADVQTAKISSIVGITTFLTTSYPFRRLASRPTAFELVII